MTQNAEVFRTPAFHIENKKCILGKTIRNGIRRWTYSPEVAPTTTRYCHCTSALTFRATLTPALQDQTDRSIPCLQILSHQKKPQQFCADEIKIELDLLLIFLNGYCLQLPPSVKRKSLSCIRRSTFRHHLLPHSSVSQGSSKFSWNSFVWLLSTLEYCK